MDEIFHRTFKYAKQLAREFYFGVWAKTPPRCPAFGGETVSITREGWEHITHEEGKTKTDIMGRLFMLERAKRLLIERDIAYDARKQKQK